MSGNNLVLVPRLFKFSSIVENDLGSSMKFRAQTPARRRAICPEHMPSLEKLVLAHTSPFKNDVTKSKNTKWMPRGSGLLPNAVATPVTLFNETVPQGYRFWLEQAAFNVIGTTDEFDFQWCVYVNGLDILNNGSKTNFPGRPVLGPQPFSLGADRASQVMAPSGANIKVVVVALVAGAAPIGSETASACIMGSLEGDIQ